MEAGTRVRLIGDPGRVGEVTGRTRTRGSRLSFQIHFSDGPQFVPEDQLERVNGEILDAVDLLEAGRLGRAIDLRRSLTHVRLTGRLADLIYSMETTNTEFFAYQFKPVLKMLNSPNQGLLIADEVGLGKTIEAGLIWTELRSRFDFRRLFVLCPAMLQKKWKDELSIRFGVEADIVGAQETLEKLRQAHRAGLNGSFAIIGSMQGLRGSRGSKSSRDLADFLETHAYEEPLIDLLIIDEAHYLKNRKSRTSRLGHRLRQISSHVALLSATPIHLGNQDLFQLLHLLDADTFRHRDRFDEVLRANAPLVKARDAILSRPVSAEEFAEMLEEARSHPLLQNSRQLSALMEEMPTSDDLAVDGRRSELAYKLGEVNLLGHTVTRTRKREVAEWRVVRQPVAEMVTMTAAEENFYHAVTETVRKYCERRDAHEGFLLVAPQRQMSSSMPAALRSWQRRADAYWGEDVQIEMYEDFGTSEQSDAPGPLTRELMARARTLGDLTVLWQEDTKYERLRSILKQYTGSHKQDKVVLFSYFRPTLQYLNERLQEDGFSSIVLMGDSNIDKNEILKTFESSSGPQILLSSEVASEGVDLQFSRLLINYDLPWNPMKIEQRIGRIDRLGQKSPSITIWNLFYGDTIDSRIYLRLFDRLNIFEQALGAIEPVLGDEITRMTGDLLRGHLSPEQEEARIEQTALALSNRQQEEEQLEHEAAHLVAHGDYILRQVNASRRLKRWVSSSDVRSYVMEYFQSTYPGCSFDLLADADEELYDISLSNRAKHDLDNFIRAHPTRSSTQLTRSQMTPVRCRFDSHVDTGLEPQIEVINHFHPVVRFVSHQLDQYSDGQYPASAVAVRGEHVEGNLRPGVYVFTVQRWTVEGLQNQEKLDFAAALLGESSVPLEEEAAERLIMAATLEGEDWLEATNVIDVKEASQVAQNVCLPSSDARYDQFVAQIQNKNEDRADIQEQTLRAHLHEQRERLNETLAKHQRENPEMVRPTEGLIRKLENRVERQLLAIQDRRQIVHRSEDICVGVINVL